MMIINKTGKNHGFLYIYRILTAKDLIFRVNFKHFFRSGIHIDLKSMGINGQHCKNRGVFCGHTNQQGTQLLLLQCVGGADSSDTQLPLQLAERQPKQHRKGTGGIDTKIIPCYTKAYFQGGV